MSNTKIKDEGLTVHEVADLLKISTDTVRRWDKKGLIKSRRNTHNHRVFSPNEAQRIYSKTIGNCNEKTRYKILKNNKHTNYCVIDLFSGAGGTALGFHNAGLNHKLLVEIDKHASATLKKNFTGAEILNEDISNICFKKYKDKIDIVEAGFPCQAFSSAGKKLGFKDTRGTLFFEFARCVNEVKPKIAVGENVRGLINHDGGRTLEIMLNVLDEIGYRATFKLLKAQYLDVPQKRERLIIMAVRKDLDMPMLFPKERNYTISVKEALENVPKSEGQKYNNKKKEVLKLVPAGGYWRNLPLDIQKEYMGKSFYHGGGKTGMARRLSWDEPSLTILCSPAQKQTERCHPKETRPLTIRESARIQTFPDCWEFQGSVGAQYKQIGNAVPVNLGFHIGEALISMLDGTLDDTKFIVEPPEALGQEPTLF